MKICEDLKSCSA